MATLYRPFPGLSGYASLVLRVVLGPIMAYHGYQKLDAGISGYAGSLDNLGVPAPEVMAWVVALVELLGGVALVLGLLTQLVALALGAVLLGAIVLVKVDVGVIAPMGGGPGAELDLAILAGLVAIVLLGPGPLSVDHVCTSRSQIATA